MYDVYIKALLPYSELYHPPHAAGPQSSDPREKINSWSVFIQMSWSDFPVVSIVTFKEKGQK